MTRTKGINVDLWWLTWALPLTALAFTLLCLYAVACYGVGVVSRGGHELEDEDE